MVSTSFFRARTSKFSELIWWDNKAAKFIESGIKTEFHFGDAPLMGENEVFKESAFHYNLAAKPFPLIIVKGQRKQRNGKTMEIEILGSFERSYQWNPAKRAFVQIGGKKRK